MNNAILVAVCLAFVVGCAPKACSDEDRMVDKEVEVLIGESGPAVKEAKRRLVERGVSCLPILETGLYHADESGRIQIIATLGEIAVASHGKQSVLPILKHVAKRDESSLVKERANAMIKKLTDLKDIFK